MSQKLCEYILAVKKYGNISEAAKRVFITPSALNQQLLKLEDELGTQLFIRSKRSLIPTEAGNIYLDYAERVIKLWQRAHSEINDIAGCDTGTYRIGLTVDHGNEVFTNIYPAFHERFPKVQMRCYQMLVPELITMLHQGDLDMTFLLGGENYESHGLEYITLSSENLMLGLNKKHRFADFPPEFTDLKLLEGDTFALCLKNSTMRTELLDPMFTEARFSPDVMVESSSNAFLEQLAVMGLCDAIIPQSQIHDHENVRWFYLPGRPRFYFRACYVKGYKLNNAMRCFVSLAHEYALSHLNFND